MKFLMDESITSSTCHWHGHGHGWRGLGSDDGDDTLRVSLNCESSSSRHSIREGHVETLPIYDSSNCGISSGSSHEAGEALSQEGNNCSDVGVCSDVLDGGRDKIEICWKGTNDSDHTFGRSLNCETP